jgi:ammonia channel protein AmtB
MVYVPVCHWVWRDGWLAELGVKDFAGGFMVFNTNIDIVGWFMVFNNQQYLY